MTNDHLTKLDGILYTVSLKLERFEERLNSYEREASQIKRDIASLKDEFKKALEEHTEDIKKSVEKLTTNDEFDPIRKLVFGFVAFILIGVGGLFFALLNPTKETRTNIDVQKSIQLPHAK